MRSTKIESVNVAVIGGAGFLGSHAVDHLIEDRHCNVLVIDNLVVGRKEFIHPQATFIHHDITTSEEYLSRLFKEHKIQFVQNWAAYPYIPVSFERPLQVFNVNATGAIKVINAAQEAGVEAILQISSAEIYGHQLLRHETMADIGDPLILAKDSPLDETSYVCPHSTYGAAKAAVDYYCQTAWRERKTPVIALRQFNCVGERETHPYVIPEIISQLAEPPKMLPARAPLAGPRAVRLGNNSTRDFLYAGDAVRMATELLEKGQFGEVYNSGSQSCIKIYELAEMISQAMGFEKVKIVEDEKRKRPWEIWHLQSDNTKLYETIQYRPEVSLPRALMRTITYFEQNRNKWGWER